MLPTWRDVDTLARTAWGEAEGEPELGRIAVCHTAIGRALWARKHTRRQFGDGTVAAACLARGQYDCWKGPRGLLVRALTVDAPGYQEAAWCALAALLGKIKDPTHGSLHYHRDDVSPPWAKGRHPVCAIGRHKFYNDVP